MSPETEPDYAVLLLQRTRELLRDCRSVAEQVNVSPTSRPAVEEFTGRG